MLRNALEEYLGAYFHDNDEPEVCLYIVGIERIGKILRALEALMPLLPHELLQHAVDYGQDSPLIGQRA